MAHQLEKIEAGDGFAVVEFRKRIGELKEHFEQQSGLQAQPLQNILDLIWLFPGLVLPLEVREDSEIVGESVAQPEKFAIGRMLQTLAKISEGNEPKWYARGFVLSMCESTADIRNGIALVEKVFGNQVLPVVPLLETEKALVEGPQMLTDLFKQRAKVANLHRKKWGGRFEVMLGYSDSSKESGVFPSRMLISTAMTKLDKTITSHQLTPVFFHGSGGSVERGGGSLREQTQWWPKSAIQIFKATIQGEMVARTFASPQIFSGQVQKIAEQWSRKTPVKTSKQSLNIMQEFSSSIQQHYQQTVHDEEFIKLVEKASPYMFLSHLKIGSRPSKRTSELKVGGLRAIPWILCWTQTRVLFPTWWGVGSTWKSFDQKQQAQLKKAYKESDLLRSYIKLLGFTLKKVELAVWRVYLEDSGQPAELIDAHFQRMVDEYASAVKFVRQLTGERNLMWYRPWLGKSIELRTPMIHPLNLLQLMAVHEGDNDLLRVTVTGVACGMLTTG
jgi:phosphoenolpyruvate carboxylase